MGTMIDMGATLVPATSPKPCDCWVTADSIGYETTRTLRTIHRWARAGHVRTKRFAGRQHYCRQDIIEAAEERMAKS